MKEGNCEEAYLQRRIVKEIFAKEEICKGGEL